MGRRLMNQEDREKLWLEFSKKPIAELREKIIIEYAGLVKIVAGKLSMYLGHNVEYDDLAALYPGANYPEVADAKAEMLLVDSNDELLDPDRR